MNRPIIKFMFSKNYDDFLDFVSSTTPTTNAAPSISFLLATKNFVTGAMAFDTAAEASANVFAIPVAACPVALAPAPEVVTGGALGAVIMPRARAAPTAIVATPTVLTTVPIVFVV